MAAYEARGTNEIAVACVRSLGGRTIEQYAYDLFDRWGIGKKDKNNGVLLLVAPTERKVRIEIGAGLVSILDTTTAQSIVGDEILPRFRARQIEGGVRAGVVEIRRVLGDDIGITERAGIPPVPVTWRPAPTTRAQDDEGGSGGTVAVISWRSSA